jgi:hypothetical protein
MSGGTSGSVDYPDYIKSQHEDWLGDVNLLMNQYIDVTDDSPYTGDTAYDPSTRISQMETALTAFQTFLNSVDPSTDWASYLESAYTKANLKLPHATAVSRADSLGSSANTLTNTIQADAAGDANTYLQTFLQTADTKLSTYIQSAIDDALSKANSAENSDLETIVDDFEEEALDTHFRSVNRFTGGMAEINSVHSSTFVMGMAMLERDFTRNVVRFRAELKQRYFDQIIGTYMQAFANMVVSYLQMGVSLTAQQVSAFEQTYRGYLQTYLSNEANRQQMVLQSTNDMQSLLLNKLQGKYNYGTAVTDASRIKIVAEKEQADRDIELDVLDAKWPFEIMNAGGQVLGSISGVPMVPEKPSQLQSAIGGAFSGVSAGATIGSKFGPTGTAVGAVAGGLAGIAGALG